MDDIIYAGIDTHAKDHAVCVINYREEVIFEGRFSANATGYRELEHALGGPKRCVCVAVEGCTGYGRGITDHLKELGYEVKEALSTEKRSLGPNGKSDEIDAYRAAVSAVRDKANPAKESEGDAQNLSVLTIARDSAIKEATALANEILGCLRTAPEPIRERYEKDTAAKSAKALCHARIVQGPYNHILMALISLSKRWKLAIDEADALKEEMDVILKQSYQRLLALKGVSTITAATIVASAGANPKRFKSEAAFAKCAGIAPIPASTANSGRHRLNRGGDRRLNSAIHQIVIVRLSCDERTKAYMAKAREKGKTRKEAIRSLKRYVVREVFHVLCSEEPKHPPINLREHRLQAGLTLVTAAKHLNTNSAKLSKLEREQIFDFELENRYAEFLDKTTLGTVEKASEFSKFGGLQI